MVVKFLQFIYKQVLTTTTLVALLAVIPFTSVHAQYGGCAYSSGNYSSTEDCDSPQSTGGTTGGSSGGVSGGSSGGAINNSSSSDKLSSTGENQKQLLVLVLSLIVGICGIGGAIALLIYSHKKSNK